MATPKSEDETPALTPRVPIITNVEAICLRVPENTCDQATFRVPLDHTSDAAKRLQVGRRYRIMVVEADE